MRKEKKNVTDKILTMRYEVHFEVKNAVNCKYY